MLKDISIGQYYPTGSVIHRLDPRVKFVGTIAFIAALFIVNNWWGYLFCALFLAALIAISKVPFKFMLKGLRSILFIVIIMMIFNIIFTPGTPIFEWHFIKISKEGVQLALKMASRLVLLVMASSLMTLTTTPNELTDGLEKLFSPLKIFHVPVHEIAMMMSIALRFIPILMEETNKIMKAQTARGADFETGGLIKKVKNMIPLLVPLFVSAFKRAGDLALAMEARCYHGGEGRTRMKPLKYAGRDFAAYAVLLVFLLACAAIRILSFR